MKTAPPVSWYITQLHPWHLENSATSEGGAIFFRNMIIKEKKAPPSKVALFLKTAPGLSHFGSTFFSQCSSRTHTHRTHTRLNKKIPVSQAAHRSGRSMTELIFSLKVLAEKAITSSSYEIHVL